MANTLQRLPTEPGLDLPRRLRVETADLHREVEATTGLPGSIRSIASYIRMLELTLGFHIEAMNSLHDSRWADAWAGLGVDLDLHDRTGALRDDLSELGGNGDPAPQGPLSLSSLGEALGCLYVIEGSALGGRFLWPAIRDQIGPVPLSFFAGEGRGHPLPWRTTQAALRTYEQAGEDADLVVAGAVTTFRAFGRALANAEQRAS